MQAKNRSFKTSQAYEDESLHLPGINRSTNIIITWNLWRRWQAHNTPSEDQRPFHICTSAECLHPAVVVYQDEHKEWLSCKLSLQQQQLWLLLKGLDANHSRARGSDNEEKLVTVDTTKAWVYKETDDRRYSHLVIHLLAKFKHPNLLLLTMLIIWSTMQA